MRQRYCQVSIGVLACLLVFGACRKKSSIEKSEREDKVAKSDIVLIRGGETPLQALELFCKYDVAGVEDSHVDVVETSPEYQRLYNKAHGAGPQDIASDPIVIVSTYHVSRVQMNDNSGVGYVAYERLGYTRGLWTDPREIIPEYKENEEVEYELRKIDGRWYVYDPPVWRVSLVRVINYYRQFAPSSIQPDFWIDPKFSNGQRKNFAQQFSDMGIIMRISADYLKRLEMRYGSSGGPGYPDKERQKRVKISYVGKWNLEIIPEHK